jgi:hypothetical protein
MTYELVVEDHHAALRAIEPPLEVVWEQATSFDKALAEAGFEGWEDFGFRDGFGIQVYRRDETRDGSLKDYRYFILLTTFSHFEEIWARDLTAVLAFLREQGPILCAFELGWLRELYQEERDDADARIEGYENRLDRQARFCAQRKAREAKRESA